MRKFYFNRSGDTFLIYDHQFSNGFAIATVYDVEIADMICEALNKLWGEKRESAARSTTDQTNPA
jgi:hypothetical protein